jgi:hypothetical protein
MMLPAKGSSIEAIFASKVDYFSRSVVFCRVSKLGFHVARVIGTGKRAGSFATKRGIQVAMWTPHLCPRHWSVQNWQNPLFEIA